MYNLMQLPELFGICKNIIDGFRRGKPSSTTLQDIQAVRGKFNRVRMGTMAIEMEQSMSLALANIADNKAPVVRSQDNSGAGDFILAIDQSGSMGNWVPGTKKNNFTLWQLGQAIAMCLYSVKPVHIYGWNDFSHQFDTMEDFSKSKCKGGTQIKACYNGYLRTLRELKKTNKLKEGTDLVIITDGQPSDDGSALVQILNLAEENNAKVWLIDISFNGLDVMDVFASIKDTYIKVRSIEDLGLISKIMKSNIRKLSR